MPTRITIGTFDEKHKSNLVKRAGKVKKLYDAAVKRLAQAAAPSLFDADENKEFHFEDFPALKKEVDALMVDLGNSLQTNIEEGDAESWTLSNTKNDAMVESVIGKTKLPRKTVEAWKHPHLEALNAFIDRKEADMGLSDRVWNLTKQFKSEMELALELGMGQGKSAVELSRDIRKYLLQPDKLFRRVRDKSGALRLSKAAAAYHPGRGVYRSSYKNALRMTATENNMAYRTADHNRWNALPFVLGIEIRISNNHPIPDICDEMAGRYPKEFKFTGWHPWCRCYAVAILAKQEEMDAYTKAMMNGEDVSNWHFTGSVEKMPKEFTAWMKNNEHRIARASSMPYFIKDNFKDGNPTMGLRWVNKTRTHKTESAKTRHDIIMENAAKRHAARTKEQTADIQARWDKSREDAKWNALDDRMMELFVGVKKGEPMSFEQANALRGNPHYGKNIRYRINCQSCVVANEMRRRGWDVEAFGNNNAKNYTPAALSRRTEAAWKEKDGRIPQKKIIGAELVTFVSPLDDVFQMYENTINDPKRLIATLEKELTTTDARYHIDIKWKDTNSGHIFTAESMGTKIRYYDPQSGRIISDISSFIKNIDMDFGIRVLRVDNLRPNIEVIRGVIKKAGSRAATPLMDKVQKTWWKDVIKSDMVEGSRKFAEFHERQKQVRNSEHFPVFQTPCEMNNLKTGMLHCSGKARDNLINHCRNVEELEVAEFIWNHPEQLRHIGESPLGEVKDLTNPKHVANLEKKKTRGVTGYQIYEFEYKNKTWKVKLETTKHGKEQFYSIIK